MRVVRGILVGKEIRCSAHRSYHTMWCQTLTMWLKKWSGWQHVSYHVRDTERREMISKETILTIQQITSEFRSSSEKQMRWWKYVRAIVCLQKSTRSKQWLYSALLISYLKAYCAPFEGSYSHISCAWPFLPPPQCIERSLDMYGQHTSRMINFYSWRLGIYFIWMKPWCQSYLCRNTLNATPTQVNSGWRCQGKPTSTDQLLLRVDERRAGHYQCCVIHCVE